MVGELNKDLSSIQQDRDRREVIGHGLGVFNTIELQKGLVRREETVGEAIILPST